MPFDGLFSKESAPSFPRSRFRKLHWKLSNRGSVQCKCRVRGAFHDDVHECGSRGLPFVIFNLCDANRTWGETTLITVQRNQFGSSLYSLQYNYYLIFPLYPFAHDVWGTQDLNRNQMQSIFIRVSCAFLHKNLVKLIVNFNLKLEVFTTLNENFLSCSHFLLLVLQSSLQRSRKNELSFLFSFIKESVPPFPLFLLAFSFTHVKITSMGVDWSIVNVRLKHLVARRLNVSRLNLVFQKWSYFSGLVFKWLHNGGRIFKITTSNYLYFILGKYYSISSITTLTLKVKSDFMCVKMHCKL